MNELPPTTYVVKSISVPLNNGTGIVEIQKYRKILPTDKLKNCLECGLCCKSFDFIEIDDPDNCDIAPEHREMDQLRGKLKVKRLANGYCPYHDVETHKCKIYDGKRPSACITLCRGDIPECYEK